METKKTRVGIVGVGWHARSVILPALMDVDGLQLVCGCTAHRETAALAEAQYRFPCYVGYEAMLADADIAAVIVVGGNQEETVIRCLEAGKHVFSETPGITTWEGAESIARLAREKNKAVVIGRCLRYAPIYCKMKSTLEEWRREDASARMFVVRYYPAVEHVYDLLFFMNGRIERLLAHGNDRQSIVSLQFANGDIGAVISCGFNNMTPEYEMFEVSGPGGLLRAMNGNHLIFHRTLESVGPKEDAFGFDIARYEGNLANFSFPYAGMGQLRMRGYSPELEYFSARIASGGGFAEARDLCRLLALKEALLESERTGNWATLRPGV